MEKKETTDGVLAPKKRSKTSHRQVRSIYVMLERYQSTYDGIVNTQSAVNGGFNAVVMCFWQLSSTVINCHQLSQHAVQTYMLSS